MQITIYGFVYFCGREVRRGKLHIKLRYFKRARRKEEVILMIIKILNKLKKL